MSDGDRMIGAAFEAYRDKQGLTQPALAVLADVSLGTVRAVEDGKNVSPDNYRKLIEVLDDLAAGRPRVFAAGVTRRGADRAGSFRGDPADLQAELRKLRRYIEREGGGG